MFVEGTKNLLTNQTAAKIPTQEIVPRNIWLNLCIDVNSFIKECFSKHSALNNTPQVSASSGLSGISAAAQALAKATGGSSGDIALLHKTKQ